ncbi:hypothetical protein B0J11DRAFT_443168 [Dendryphion nanum]|uniref:Uncharacterized protein n=1 Tax=Dendryphion nanum TaxID=256645 RepID=A0A9P9DAM2_9PLEO|nr:hypothetical protein B0J11DRAFT_443168 [Dendryphion nanum]
MTSLFLHPPYAEDQPSSHAILYLHITRATAMTASFASLISAPTSLFVSRYRYSTPMNLTNLTPRLLTHASRGLAIGTALGIAMTWSRMRGRDEIEWQDRAWRLLENGGEKETDWWVLGGAATGAVVGLAGVMRGKIPVGVGKSILGGAGVGMGVGVPYMVSTYARGRKPA